MIKAQVRPCVRTPKTGALGAAQEYVRLKRTFVPFAAKDSLVRIAAGQPGQKPLVINGGSSTVVSVPPCPSSQLHQISPDRTPRQNLSGFGTFVADRWSGRSQHTDERVRTAPRAPRQPCSSRSRRNDGMAASAGCVTALRHLHPSALRPYRHARAWSRRTA